MHERIKDFVKSPVAATLIAQFVGFSVWIHEVDKRLSRHEEYIAAQILEKPVFRILSLEERMRINEIYIARQEARQDNERLAARMLALEERMRIAEEEINELEAVRDGRLSKSA